MLRKLLIALSILMIIGAVVGMLLHRERAPIPPIVKPVIATQPASQPTTRKAAKPKYPSYFEVIRLENKAVAATQPLDSPLDLPDAAHLIFHDPVYLDPIGNLWITRADGEPTAKALATAADNEEHIITDRPVFVHWFANDRGSWTAAVVVKCDTGGFDIITKTDRRHLVDDRPFNWDSAFSLLGKIVVNTDVGVDVFDVEPKIVAHYHPLPGVTPACNPPATLLDTRGILAWSPWEMGKNGSNGVSRFVDGNWQDLPATDWPARPIQLSMLLDGSVLRIAAGMPTTSPSDPADDFPDQVHLSIGEIDSAQFDDAHINELIQKLSDPDGDVRQAAFDELSRYGPALSVKLEKVMDDQVPEAKMRIRQLLRIKLGANLAGMTPVDGRLDVVRRCPDGTVIFFAPSGVQIPTEHDEPDIVNPAWLAMRSDGRMDHPLSDALVKDQKPEACTLRAVHDEWLVIDEAGPRRLVGSLFEPLLLPAEKRFIDLVGMGTRHRWIFRDPVAGDTLLIDPLIADPTPKLPAWVISVDKGAAGWDAEDFPAMSKDAAAGAGAAAGPGAAAAPGAVGAAAEPTSNWALDESGWKAITPPQKVITKLDPTTQPATNSASGSPLLKTADGTQYFDGKNSLVVVKSTGEKITWPLPAEAVGSAQPTLLKTSDGLLFLFNQAGRLARIRPTPTEAQPFKLEAVFTKDIPNVDQPTRIWLDPAGRIDFVSDDNILTITFPAGHIPKEISRMMLDGGH
jgi:hypothetical protein